MATLIKNNNNNFDYELPLDMNKDKKAVLLKITHGQQDELKQQVPFYLFKCNGSCSLCLPTAQGQTNQSTLFPTSFIYIKI